MIANERLSTYFGRCMAGAGFCVMHRGVAHDLCRDIFHDLRSFDGDPPAIAPGTLRMVAQLEGIGEVTVWTRSTVDLARRIELVTGHAVRSVAPVLPAAPAMPPFAWQRKHPPEVYALAHEQEPSHDCGRRRDILAAKLAVQQETQAKDSARAAYEAARQVTEGATP